MTAVQLGRIEQFLDEPRLTDPGLALDDQERRRGRARFEQQTELPLASDQNRRREASERRLAVRRVAAAVYPCRR
jgi:hypothetical protein